MTTNIIFFVAALSVPFLEITFDHWMWNRGNDDKPWSTILRFFGTFALTYLSYFFIPILKFPLMVTAAYALFDPVLNVSRGKAWCYHPLGSVWEDFWRKRKGWQELLLRIVWFAVGVYFYWFVG